MENLTEELNEFIKRLETEDHFEMSEEMQEQYFELKEAIIQYRDHKLIDKFNKLWEIYENPDSKEEAILRDMYPDTDGQFDLDDFWKD